MKNKALKLSMTVLTLALLAATGCKKKDTTTNPATSTETGQSSADNRDVQNENDAAVNDMNSSVYDQHDMHGRTASTAGLSGITGTLCGFSIDTTSISSGSIVLNYSGATCNNRQRSGSIRVSIQNYSTGVRWKDQGCTIRLEYDHYKVTRSSDQKSMEFNGVQIIKNESGGSWWELLIMKSQSSLVTSVSTSDLAVTFNDNKTATYNINRRFTYTFPGNILTCTAEGIGSSGGLNNLENYGTTRDGNAFTSQVNIPLVWTLTCGPWAPIQGDVMIKVATQNYSLHAVFGVDVNGNAVSTASGNCPYGWKLTWADSGHSNTKIFGYL